MVLGNQKHHMSFKKKLLFHICAFAILSFNKHCIVLSHKNHIKQSFDTWLDLNFWRALCEIITVVGIEEKNKDTSPHKELLTGY